MLIILCNGNKPAPSPIIIIGSYKNDPVPGNFVKSNVTDHNNNNNITRSKKKKRQVKAFLY